MKTLSVLLLVAFLARNTYGQVWGFGTCPNIPPAKMDLKELEGSWYESDRSFFMPEINQRCVQATYTVEGSSAKIRISLFDSLAEIHQVINGRVDPIVTPADGRLQLTLQNLAPVPMLPTPTVGVVYPYSIIKIDRDFMIKYSCRNFRISPFFPSHFQSVWVLVRDPTYPDAVKNKVEAAMKQFSLSTSLLSRTDRNCPSHLNFRAAADSSQVENEVTPLVNSTISE